MNNSSRRGQWLLVAAAVTALAAGIYWQQRPPAGTVSVEPTVDSAAAAANTTYVGTDTCAGCHVDVARRWRDSHHAQAMQAATSHDLRARFDGKAFHDARGTGFVPRTTSAGYTMDIVGAGDKPASFPVRYTFGVAPLQQYLLDTGRGRLQALTIAWDTRPAADGGQRWFDLHGADAVTSGDLLHWSGPAYNWNHTCADCHALGVDKRYDASRGAFDTHMVEIGVGCEGCHGPGSVHVAWARGAAGGSIAQRGLALALSGPEAKPWRMDPARGVARRVDVRTAPDPLLDVCGPCHARRSQLDAGHRAGDRMDEHYALALLQPEMYFDDGQMREEVFELGSFLQSKMHAAGVSCNDCHEPHGLTLRAEGNAVCTGCHLPAKFDTPAHHHHAPSGTGAQCVDCHMPARIYMVVDPRRDHSLRIPRPDLAPKLDTPDACTTCHRDRTAAWAAQAASAWWGDPIRHGEHYGEILHAARTWQRGAGARVAALVVDPTRPAIVRASAATLLGRFDEPAELVALRAALVDPDPLVRLGAIEALGALPPSQLLTQLLIPRLSDDVRAVRLAAAPLAAGFDATAWPDAARRARGAALADYRRTLAYNADRAEAQLNLALLAGREGDAVAEEAAYQRAIALAPRLPFGYVNLADVQARAGRLDAAQATLAAGLAQAPDDADLLFAQGLIQVRQKRYADAVRTLERAHRRAPDNPYYLYTLAVALIDTGAPERGRALVRQGRARFPGYPPLATLALERSPRQ